MLYQELVYLAPLNCLMTLLLSISLANILRRGFHLFQYPPEIEYIYSSCFILLWFFSLLMLSAIQGEFIKNFFFAVILKFILFTSFIDFIFFALRKKIKTKIFSHLISLNKKHPFYFILAGLTLLIMYLIALSPPTDADSLRYHLGFPAKALYDGHFYEYEWIHGRLFGYGELLNLLGLFVGTDSFGSFLQVSSLTALLYLFIKKAKQENLWLAIFLVITPVFLLFLCSSQKASLLPSLGLITSFSLLYNNKSQLNPKTMVFALIPLYFAMGCKYSYAITGFSIFLYGLYLAYKNQKFFLYLLINIALLILIYCPLLWVKYQLYGDPLSPLLEFLKENPSKYLLQFIVNIKSSRESTLPFPLGLFFPAKPGQVSTIFGLSFFVILFSRKLYQEKKELFYFNMGHLALSLLLAKYDSRFFLEVYLLLSFAIIQLKPCQSSLFFTKALSLQSLALFPLYLYACFSLFPGALSENLRNQVLRKQAYFFNIGEQTSQIKPKGKTLMLTGVSYFSPPKFIHGDILKTFKDEESLNSFIKKEEVYFLTSSTPQGSFLKKTSCSPKQTSPFNLNFKQETRNPFNRTRYEVYFYHIEC